MQNAAAPSTRIARGGRANRRAVRPGLGLVVGLGREQVPDPCECDRGENERQRAVVELDTDPGCCDDGGRARSDEAAGREQGME